MTNQNNALVVF